MAPLFVNTGRTLIPTQILGVARCTLVWSSEENMATSNKRPPEVDRLFANFNFTQVESIYDVSDGLAKVTQYLTVRPSGSRTFVWLTSSTIDENSNAEEHINSYFPNATVNLLDERVRVDELIDTHHLSQASPDQVTIATGRVLSFVQGVEFDTLVIMGLPNTDESDLLISAVRAFCEGCPFVREVLTYHRNPTKTMYEKLLHIGMKRKPDVEMALGMNWEEHYTLKAAHHPLTEDQLRKVRTDVTDSVTLKFEQQLQTMRKNGQITYNRLELINGQYIALQKRFADTTPTSKYKNKIQEKNEEIDRLVKENRRMHKQLSASNEIDDGVVVPLDIPFEKECRGKQMTLQEVEVMHQKHFKKMNLAEIERGNDMIKKLTIKLNTWKDHVHDHKRNLSDNTRNYYLDLPMEQDPSKSSDDLASDDSQSKLQDLAFVADETEVETIETRPENFVSSQWQQLYREPNYKTWQPSTVKTVKEELDKLPNFLLPGNIRKFVFRKHTDYDVNSQRMRELEMAFKHLPTFGIEIVVTKVIDQAGSAKDWPEIIAFSTTKGSVFLFYVHVLDNIHSVLMKCLGDQRKVFVGVNVSSKVKQFIANGVFIGVKQESFLDTHEVAHRSRCPPDKVKLYRRATLSEKGLAFYMKS